MSKLDTLDKNKETNPLKVGELELKLVLHTNLKKLLRDEDLKWRQRAKEKDLKEGHGNTRYFQVKVSG